MMKQFLTILITAVVLASIIIAGCMENVTNNTTSNATNATIPSSKTSTITAISKITATEPKLRSSPTLISAPSLSITTLRLAPDHPQYFEWDIANTGTTDAWVAPYAIFYKQTATAPGHARVGDATARYAHDDTAGNWATAYNSGGYDWFNTLPGHTYHFYSSPMVREDTKWAVYNARLYYNEAFHGWFYSSWPYATLR